MITGALIGALVLGGPALVIAVTSDETFWRVVTITAGVAMAGAGMVGGMTAAVTSGSNDCPDGTVKAGAHNELYTGCIPVELAKKQVENQ